MSGGEEVHAFRNHFNSPSSPLKNKNPPPHKRRWLERGEHEDNLVRKNGSLPLLFPYNFDRVGLTTNLIPSVGGNLTSVKKYFIIPKNQ